MDLPEGPVGGPTAESAPEGETALLAGTPEQLLTHCGSSLTVE
uniref:KASH domain containing 5 n=1 Tax=Homo sapiens TaxID=9606 RepID=M0QZT9_HUMAN